MELPKELRYALESELTEISPKRLAQIASGLSGRYRENRPAGWAGRKSFIESREDVFAYAAFRMPATFAAVYSALDQVREVLPGWKPQTLLDAGAGPGTVIWAADAIYPDIKAITLLEREDGMIELGKRLAKHASSTSIRNADWISADIKNIREVFSRERASSVDSSCNIPDKVQSCDFDTAADVFDLVAASYVLGELDEKDRKTFLENLWKITSGILIIIEPGTPAGFLRIKQAREQLINEGGVVVAPCPHNARCPMAEDDWCHFSRRISRSRLHRQIKAGELSYEDEKFSFVAVARKTGEAMHAGGVDPGEASPAAERAADGKDTAGETPPGSKSETEETSPGRVSVPGRVLRHPLIRKGYIEFEVCGPGGISRKIVTRRDREMYRKARDLGWGSIFPGPICPKQGNIAETE